MEVSYYVVKLLMGLVMAAVKCGCMAAVSLEGENGEKIHYQGIVRFLHLGAFFGD